MQKILLTTLVAISLSISSTSFAQDTSTSEQPAADTNAADATAKTIKKEDQAFPVAEEPKNKIGSDYVAEEHGDWKIVCTSTGKDNKPNCRVFQLLKDEADNAVAELSILALSGEAQAAAGVNFVTPLGTLLSAQVAMRVDAGKAKRYPFSWCEQLGCVTRFGLTQVELDNMKKGSEAVMTIVSVGAPRQPIGLPVSLSGFTAAWDALVAMNAE
ncbi:MAG: invasion associated locus B family protein [Proteobacteria bacterium]|nr:invasion associated locus B family protein [Pseudomonadota bacterium]